jgi:O-antigen ligase
MPKLGVIALAGFVALTLLHPAARVQLIAMLAAAILAPALLIIDIWHSPQLSVVHRHPAVAAVGALVLVGVVVGLALVLLRRPSWVALLIIVALPFRIPIQAGGTTSNLLVPLYLVVAAGVLAFAIESLRGTRVDPDPEPEVAPDTSGRWGWLARINGRWVMRLLAGFVGLYAVQATYSPDFEKALQQMVFFYVPFALMFALLRRLEWPPALVRRCLVLVGGLAVIFAFIGFAEYATKTIILNPKLVVQNDLHAYFTVNSVFFDPDIFGRFLAIVMIGLVAALLYARERRQQLLITGVLAILWAGLVLTLSRSSLGALLVGLAVLGTVRWRPRGTLIVSAAVVVIGAVVVIAHPTTFGLNQGFNGASSGRAGLIGGGVHMFSQRPVWGFGSGAFVTQYRAEHPGTVQTLAASHTIAVTIAAEQGLIGLLVYLALVLTAVVVLLRGVRGDPARAGIGAAFVALMLHTNLYADFLEDPLTWTLLGVGLALAARARVPEAAPASVRAPAASGRAVPSPAG